MSSHSILACDGPSTEKPDNSRQLREGPGALGGWSSPASAPEKPPSQPHTHPGCPRRRRWPPRQSLQTCRRHHPPAQGPKPAPSDCRTRCPLSLRRDCKERATQESAKVPILEAGWPEPCRGEGVPPLKCSSRALPAPDILATPCDCDGVCAGNHGVILEAIDTIAQVLLLHTLFSLC